MRPLYGRVGFLDVLFFWTFYLSNKLFQCSWQWLLPFMSYEFKPPFNLKWITYFEWISYLLLILRFSSFNPIQDGHFRGCSRIGEGGKKVPLPKICHTYPTMMKLGTVIPYLKKIQEIYESRDTPPEFCWHQHFFTGNQQI